MARPRKNIRSSNGKNEIQVELIKVIATTEEQKQKLVEARKLVAHFIGLHRARKLLRAKKEILTDAA
jgi:hypothetical protein